MDHQTWGVLAYEFLDVDDDGDLDIIVMGRMGGVGWLENAGGGEFWERHEIDSFGTLSGTFVLVDIDGDGDLDIVALSHSSNRLVWCENSGNASFAPFVDITDPMLSMRHIAVGDVNGDGVPEVLLVIGGNTSAVRIVSFSGNGEFALTAPVLSEPFGFKRFNVLDMDGDGVLDLLYLSGPNMATALPQLARGNGNGTFQEPEDLWNEFIFDMVPTDLNMDGTPDLIVNRNGQLAYMTAQAGGALMAPVIIDSIPAITNAFSFAAVDMDGDGLMDLAGTWGYEVFWYPWQGSQFGPRNTLSHRPLNGNLKIVDINGDGLPDVLNASHSESGLVAFLNAGGGAFSQLTPLGRGLGQVFDLIMCDLDNDGVKDVVVASRHDSRVAWFPGDPQKFLEPYVLIDVDAHTAISLVATDDNDDGHLDLIVALNNAGRIVRYTNLGGGLFGPGEVILDGLGNARHVLALDLNEDGMDDLVISDSFGRTLYTMFRTGAATYADPVVIDDDELVAYNITYADLDGDGLNDLIAPSFLHNSVYWYRNLGDGAFGPRQIALTGTVQVGMVQAVDLDGDGLIDLASRGAGLRANWSRNLGDAVFGPLVLLEAGSSAMRSLYSGDLDTDGDQDLVVVLENDSMIIYWNNGQGEFERGSLDANGNLVGALLITDADGDGDLDIFYTENEPSRLRYLENYILGGMRATGHIYSDLDGDGQRGSGEPPMSFQIASVPSVSSPISMADGSYTLYLPEGSFVVAPTNFPPYWGISSDSLQYHLAPDGSNNMFEGLDFGFFPLVDTTILSLSTVPQLAPCGGGTTHSLKLINQGTTTPSGTIAYSLDGAFTLLTGVPLPDSIVGSTFWWSFSELAHGQSLSIQCHLVNPPSVDVPDLSNNVLHVYASAASGTMLDTFMLNTPHGVACGFDPNDKLVLPVGYGECGAVPITTTQLTYTVRFQNLGGGPAFDIRLRDRLSEHLDPHSIELIGWSHQPADVRVEADGELAVLFRDIMLPPAEVDSLGSQGHITFRAQILPERAHLTLINNSAEIYFDHEAAVVTNTTSTTLVDCALWMPFITAWGAELQAEQGVAYQWFLNGEAIQGATEQYLWASGSGYYHAEVMSEFGCVASSAPAHVLITSLEEPAAIHLRIYPVPFTDRARLVANRPLIAEDQIILYDVHGRILGQWQGQGAHELQLQRNGLVPGVYVVRVLTTRRPLGQLRVVVE